MFLSLSLLLLAASPDVTPSVVVRSESRAGQVPLGITTPPVSVVEFEVTPDLFMQARWRRLTLGAGYAPRLLYRLGSSVGRPLFLHQTRLESRYWVTRQLLWTTEGALRVGEADYGAAGLLFDRENPGALPDAAVIGFLTTSAGTEAAWQVARNDDLVFAFNFERTTSFGDATAAGFPTQKLFVPSLEHRHRWSDVDMTYARARFEYADFEALTRLRILHSELAWRHFFSSTWQFEATAGATFVKARASEVFPTARIENLVDLIRRARMRISLGQVLGVEGFVHPLFGVINPRARVELSTQLNLVPRWSVQLRGSFFATFAPPEERSFDDTQIFVTLPVRYQMRRDSFLEWGVRASMRGPSLADERFVWGGEMLIAYLALQFSALTLPEDGDAADTLELDESIGAEIRPIQMPDQERDAESRDAPLREGVPSRERSIDDEEREVPVRSNSNDDWVL